MLKMDETAKRELLDMLDDEMATRFLWQGLKGTEKTFVLTCIKYDTYRKCVESLCTIFGLCHEGLQDAWERDVPMEAMSAEEFQWTYSNERNKKEGE